MPEKKVAIPNVSKGVVGKVDAYAENNASFKAFRDHVAGERDYYVMQSSRHENKAFDEGWIHELEVGFNAIDRIIRNPRSFIKENPQLVLAGKAKKINAQSITHLASHTQYVHGVDEHDNVIPEKILNIDSDVDIQIYENRVLMTLIGKLSFFVERRYAYIKEHGETRNSDVLLVHSVNDVDGLRYEVDTRVKVSVPSEDEGKAELNRELVEKIKRLRERVTYYMNSQFMKEMYGAKAVKNPLALTNLLMKNPDYHAVLVLWKFVDNYTKLGVEYDINDSRAVFTPEYLREITNLVSFTMLTVRSESAKGRYIELKPVLSKHLAPKVLLSLEDETFLFGPFHDWTFAEYAEDIPENNEPMALSPEEVKNLEEAYKEAIREEALRAQMVRDEIAEQNAEQALLERDEMLRRRREKAEEEERLRLLEEAKRQAYEEHLMRRLQGIDDAYDEETAAKEEAALEATRQAVLGLGVGIPLAQDVAKEEPPAPDISLGPVPEEAYVGPVFVAPLPKPLVPTPVYAVSAVRKEKGKGRSFSIAFLKSPILKPSLPKRKVSLFAAFEKSGKKDEKPEISRKNALYFAAKKGEETASMPMKKAKGAIYFAAKKRKGETI